MLIKQTIHRVHPIKKHHLLQPTVQVTVVVQAKKSITVTVLVTYIMK